MKKSIKALSVFLAVLMLLTAAPLQGLSGIDWSGFEASAAGRVDNYSATAGAEYAKRYALSYNKEWYFYENGGDCANFLSQALFAGGMSMTSTWHCYDSNSSSYCMDDYTWIQADNLMNYLVSIGGTKIVNPSPSQFSLGDAVFYDWNLDGNMNHSAIVTAIDNGVPKVSAHSTPESQSVLNTHWTYGSSSKCCVLVKLYGATCDNNYAKSYDIFRPNTALPVMSNPGWKQRNGDTVKRWVIRVPNADPSGYSAFNFEGYTGYVDLSKTTKIGHWDKIEVSHKMGNWYTKQAATCSQKGIEERKCSRCGYTEQRQTGIGGAHQNIVPATCINPSYCKVCGEVIAEANGHDMGEWTYVVAPTCLEGGSEKQVCNVCGYNWFYKGTKTKYRYRTRSKTTTYHYYKWSDWSDWGVTPATANDNTQVETRTTYSFRQDALDHAWGTTVTIVPTCHEDGYSTAICSRCGISRDKTNITPALGDNFGEWKLVSSEDGVNIYRRDCTNFPQEDGTCQCGHYELKTEYDCVYEPVETVEPTCSEEGYTLYRCSVHENASECQKQGSKYEFKADYVDALGHEADNNWYVVTPATCEESGLEMCKCVRHDDGQTCDKTYEREIAASGHDYKLIETLKASCTEDGYKYYECSLNAEHNYKDVLPATGHNMGEEIHYYNGKEDENETACGEHKWVKECQNEGCEYKEERFAFIEHTFGEPITIDPTCVADGITYHTCENCGYYEEIGRIPALGHDFKHDDDRSFAQTCTDEGLDAYNCLRCGETDDKVIVPTGHSTSPLDENYDAVDDKMELISSIANVCGDGTVDTYRCTHINNGERCEYTITIGEANDHNLGEYIVTKEPTCTEIGYQHKKCQNDGCTFKTEDEEIPALGHKAGDKYIVKASCTANGAAKVDCVRCGQGLEESTIFARNHKWSKWHTDKEPTCTTDGFEQRECLNSEETDEYLACSEVETSLLKALNHNFTAWIDTGDGEHHSRDCSRGDASETEAHAWDDGKVTKKATAEEAGEITYTCTVCGAVKTEPIVAKGWKVKFIDEDESSLGTQTGATLEEVKDKQDEPTKDADAQYTYTFDFWEEVSVNSDEGTAEYKAVYKETLNSYTVKFVDDDGSVLETQSVEYGKVPTYGGEISSKAATAQHTYTFKEWTPQIAAVTCDATYTATYSAKVNSYTVKFVDKDGSVLSTQNVEYGKSALAPAEPKEDADSNNHYEFEKWDKDFSFITADLTVTAIFKAEKHKGTDKVITKPTCTEKGEKEIRCSVCNWLIDTAGIDALGHDYHKIESKSKAPDYGIDGYDYYECSHDASHYYTETVPALVKNTYTVTFVADGETVEVVTFSEGDSFVKEPKVPDKDNHTGEWEEYTLSNKNITVNAVYTPIDLDNISEIETEKSVDKFEDGVATITLSATAATRAVQIPLSSTKPVDVVLVLDLSGSMKDPLGSSGQTKLDALKACAKSFIGRLNDNAVATGNDHRVALVGFASGVKVVNNMTAFENTGIIVPGVSKLVPYLNITQENYKEALMSTGNITGINTDITNAISELKASGATNTQLGLKMAQNILNVSDSDGREKIVVLLTDGVPTSAYSTYKEYIRQVAPLAITYANEIKSTGTKIYTIGVDEDANENAQFDSSFDGLSGSNNNATFDFNRFLNIVSSNYPNAKAMNNYGQKQNSGYYMSNKDTSKLDEIFTKIIVSAVNKPVAFTKCNIVDTLSSDFTLTLEQEYALREKLINDYNLDNGDISIKKNSDGTTTIKIIGVPVVKTEVDGKTVYRAAVTLEASLNKFEEGKYATNTEDARLEIGDDKIADFAVPEKLSVSPARNIVVFKINGEVYRIDEGDLGDEIIAPNTDLAKWSIPNDAVISGNYAEFEAEELNSDKYTLTWNIDGEEMNETYTFGEAIKIPDVANKDDLDFVGFTPAVPYIMPARNMTFTAVFAPKHVHSFKQTSFYGTCTSGLTIVSTCTCGETKEEKIEAKNHSFVATAWDTYKNTIIDTLTCSVCGHNEDHTLSFKTLSVNRRTYLDLTLEKDGMEIQPAEGSSIKIRIPWTNQAKTNTEVTVYRLNEDGKQVTYTGTFDEDGYLVFYADHFSIYIVDENETIEPISYEYVMCEFNAHNYNSSVTTPATCKEEGIKTFTCSSCGDTYTETIAKDTGNHANYGTKTVNAKSATCTTEGYTGDKVCKGCGKTVESGKKIPKLDHTPKIIPAVAPTCTTSGKSESIVCSVCNTVIKPAETIPAFGHSDNNGDGKCDDCGKDLSSGGQSTGKTCKYCGQVHTGLWGKIVGFFHAILALFGLHK